MNQADFYEVVIEIPRGSRNKYELDHETGEIWLDRMLFTAMQYPLDYGFFQDTLAADGDPLDALVLLQEPTFPGCHITRGRRRAADERREGAGRQGAVRARDRPALVGYAEIGDVPELPARRDRALLRRLQGARAGQELRDAVDGRTPARRSARSARHAPRTSRPTDRAARCQMWMSGVGCQRPVASASVGCAPSFAESTDGSERSIATGHSMPSAGSNGLTALPAMPATHSLSKV